MPRSTPRGFPFLLPVLLAYGCANPKTVERDVLTARVHIEADYDAVWDRFTRALVPIEDAARNGAPMAWPVEADDASK